MTNRFLPIDAATRRTLAANLIQQGRYITIAYPGEDPVCLIGDRVTHDMAIDGVIKLAKELGLDGRRIGNLERGLHGVVGATETRSSTILQGESA